IRVRYFEPDPQTGTSKAVIVDRHALIHTAQFFPLRYPQSMLIGKTDIGEQTQLTLLNLYHLLGVAKPVIKLNVYLTRAEDIPQVQAVLARWFTITTRRCPAVTYIVGGLALATVLVAMDAIAVERSWRPNAEVQWLRDFG